MSENVLIIGSGGREHAIAWKLTQSPHVKQIFVASGNAGTQWEQNDDGLAASQNVAIDVSDFASLIEFAIDNSIALTVVGPEVPLAQGLVDLFQQQGLTIFGPSQAAAELEASKAFSKVLMKELIIPTADFGIFEDTEEAKLFVRRFNKPVVVKADGLAAGKGVLICDTLEEAETAIDAIMDERQFGDAGNTIVIEEKLSGREISILAFCDGKVAVPMKIARDHKRALDGDQGLNTGGMGAFAPTDDISDNLFNKIVATCIQPIVDGMEMNGTPYHGVLFAGFMIDGETVNVLEYNCRFGDPETQVVLPLLKTDLYEVMMACIDGTLSELNLEWHDQACASVILASGGYPERYENGYPIRGLEDASKLDDVMVFHAGTKIQDNEVVTSGGRVLNITALGDNVSEALDKAYAAIECINFQDMHFRTDIGTQECK